MDTPTVSGQTPPSLAAMIAVAVAFAVMALSPWLSALVVLPIYLRWQAWRERRWLKRRQRDRYESGRLP